MSVIPYAFYRGTAPLTPTLLYTHTAANGHGILMFIELANTVNASGDFTFYIVPSGGTYGTSNILVAGDDGHFRPKQGVVWRGYQPLAIGDMLYGGTSVSGAALKVTGNVVR